MQKEVEPIPPPDEDMAPETYTWEAAGQADALVSATLAVANELAAIRRLLGAAIRPAIHTMDRRP